MLMKIYQVVFFFTLMIGTIIACSANSWFTCWLGLEINLMSLIPLLVIKLTPLSTETAIKYFLAQAMASLMIIFSSLLDSSVSSVNMMTINNEIILVALSVKAGMAPFHFWFPQVMKIADWAQCTLILTWQKIAPFILMMSLNKNLMAILIVVTSAMIGMLGGLNQMNLKNILTYSSIAHSAWMLAICLTSSIHSWALYFFIYTTISISIIYFVYKTKLNFMDQMLTIEWNKLMKISFFMSLMSLGGLPPFLGFTAKLMAIQMIIMNLTPLVAMILISSSLVSLYYYTRMIYGLMLNNAKMNMIFKDTKNKTFYIISSLSITGNLMAPIMVLLT